MKIAVISKNHSDYMSHLKDSDNEYIYVSEAFMLSGHKFDKIEVAPKGWENKNFGNIRRQWEQRFSPKPISMEVRLTKEDLANLVSSVSPNYSLFDHPIVKGRGTYIGGFCEKWEWGCNLEKELSESELWELYVMCRDSYNK